MSKISALDTYLDDIGHSKPPTAEEELALVKANRRGLLVERSLRLVVSVAKRFTGQGIELEDLIQIGNIALMRAAKGFDPALGRFSTYAFRTIERALSRATATEGGFGYIPADVGTLARRLREIGRSMTQELGRDPTPDELAQRMGVARKKVDLCLRALRPSLSLNRRVFRRDAQSPDFEDLLPDKSPPIDETVVGRIFAEGLWATVEQIVPTNELRVLELRFGRNGGYPHTLKEAGEQIGKSQEWVRRLQDRALGRLRESPEFAPFLIA